MKITILAVAGLALLAGSADAQRMGGINRNAPSIEQKIKLGESTVSLNYTAVNYGSGRWADALKNEATREQFRNRVNQTADSAPMGSFSCSEEMYVGGVEVEEGDYKLAFKISEEYAWTLELKNDDRTITIPLALTESPMNSPRLILAIYAGEEDGTAGVYISFGDQTGDLSITGDDDDDDDDDDD